MLLDDVLHRVRSGTTKVDDARWLRWYVGDLQQKVVDLRAKLAAWAAWEHAWVFGGDAPYPGSPGVTDPRETLDDLERLALGVPLEGEEG